MFQRPLRRAVVTGGAGFIGSHLVERLLVCGAPEVVVFDDLSTGRASNLAAAWGDPRFTMVEGDVADGGALAAVLRPQDVVFHLAARRPGSAHAAGSDYLFGSNVVGTMSALRAAVSAGVARFLFASSQDVYGQPISLPVDEDHPLMTNGLYGASKAAGEAYCRAFRREHGLPTVILRLATVYGPRERGGAVSGWLAQAAIGETMCVLGGRQLIDFVWIDQVVEALVRAAAMETALPPINVASGTGTRAIDAVRRVARLLHATADVQELPSGGAPQTQFVANVERMRQFLRIEPPLDPLAFLPSLLGPTTASQLRS